jgi:hypothetical protein
MTGFPDCLKEVRVKFHVIDALYNKGQLGIPVKTTTTRGVMTETTDEAGCAHLGPFIPGEAVKVDVHKEGFDDISQEFVAEEGVDFKMLGMNPTGPDLRLILTWGPTPSDLDSEVKFFDASGNEVCKLYWNNKHCEDYASLDVDETNGGDNGPETISVKNVPEGITVMYYVKDFSNKIGKTMSWKDSQAKEIFLLLMEEDTSKFLLKTLKWMEESDTSSLVVLITLVMLDSIKLVKQPLIHLTNVKSSFNI